MPPFRSLRIPDNGGIDAVAEKYAKIGCDYVALPYIFGDTYPNGPKADEGFKSIENVADACMKYGMPLLYHNHESELEFCDDGQMILDKLYSLHDAKKFQAEFDLGWLSNGRRRSRRVYQQVFRPRSLRPYEGFRIRRKGSGKGLPCCRNRVQGQRREIGVWSSDRSVRDFFP